MLSTRSPGRTPIDPSAARARDAGEPGCMYPIFADSVSIPWRYTATNSTAAVIMFISTPAEITIIRFHTGHFW
jgi:hypothetical protein